MTDAQKPPIPGMLSPTRFGSKEDEKNYRYAESRVADKKDLNFYLQKMNDGHVLMPSGGIKRVVVKS